MAGRTGEKLKSQTQAQEARQKLGETGWQREFGGSEEEIVVCVRPAPSSGCKMQNLTSNPSVKDEC